MFSSNNFSNISCINIHFMLLLLLFFFNSNCKIGLGMIFCLYLQESPLSFWSKGILLTDVQVHKMFHVSSREKRQKGAELTI